MDLPIDPYECDRCRYVWQTKELRLCPWHKASLGVGVFTHPRQLDAAVEQKERRAAPGCFDLIPERVAGPHRPAQRQIVATSVRHEREPESSLVDELDL